MNVKDVIEIDITDNGMNGEGVGRLDGKVVFVPFTLKGERVRAVVGKVTKTYAQASAIKIIIPSENRVKPICPHYYKCGGCDTEHLSPSFRRAALVAELKNNFKKIAGLTVEPDGFFAADGAKRNKLSMPFGVCDGRIVVGMYRQNTHEVVPVECLMAGERTAEAVRSVLRFCNEKKLSVYEQNSGRGTLRHIVVRDITGCARISVTLVVSGDGLSPRDEDELASRLGDGVDFFISPNEKRNNVVMGDSVRLVKGNSHLDVDVLGVKAKLSPLSFFQVNDGVRDMLYSRIQSLLCADTLVDLYSGIGITSNLAARKVDNVVAIECVPQAVADAKETAELNGNASRIRNICGDVTEVLPRIADELGAVDILVDPPRKGCGDAVMRVIARAATSRLIYVSCNHATMCRDIRTFIDAAEACGKRFTVCACDMFDMFVGTHHVETLVCLEIDNRL